MIKAEKAMFWRLYEHAEVQDTINHTSVCLSVCPSVCRPTACFLMCFFLIFEFNLYIADDRELNKLTNILCVELLCIFF